MRGMLDVGFFVGLASVERITPKRRREFWRDLMETGRGGNWKDFPNCLDGKQKEEKKLLKQHNCPKHVFLLRFHERTAGAPTIRLGLKSALKERSLRALFTSALPWY